MKHKIGNVLRNLLLTVLLFSLTVMPVNAETESPDLVAADYQVGMESFVSIFCLIGSFSARNIV